MINEVASASGDFVEFFNPGQTAVNVSGWFFTDNDPDAGPTHVFTFGANTIVEPKAFLVIENGNAAGQFPFGLGDGDSVILRNAAAEKIDELTWTGAANTFGRCPDGTGASKNMTRTKGTANACSTDGGTD